MQIPSWFGRWVLSHPLLIAVLITIATVPCVMALFNASFDTSIIASFMTDETELQRYIQRATDLGGDSDDLLYVATVEGDSLFTAKTLNAIRRCAADIEKNIPEVESVLCMANMPRIGGNYRRSVRDIAARRAARLLLAKGEVPESDRSFPLFWPKRKAKQAKVDLANLKENLLDNPSIYRVLLSDDGKAQVMIMKLSNPDDVPPIRQFQLLGELRETIHKHGLGREGIHATGVIVAQGFMMEQVNQALWTLFPLGGLVICVIVYLIFRRISIVILTNVIAAIAIIWSLGITTFIYGEITILMSGIPLIVLVLSTSDTIHLASAYMTERERGCTHEQALDQTINEVGGACILTSITTFVGFLSMMIVPAATTRHFALGSAIGVGSALLLALTLVPLALKWLQPVPSAKKASSVFNHGVDAIVNSCRHLSLKYPAAILVVTIVAVGAIVWNVRDLRLDPDPITRFRKNHPVRVAVEYFNEHLSGTNIIEVFLSAEPETLHSVEFARTMVAFEEKCLEVADVRSLFSLISLYRIGDKEIGFNTDDGLPESSIMARAYLQLLGEGKNDVVKQVVNLDAGLSRILVRVQPTALLDIYHLAEEIDDVAEEVFPDSVEVESTGSLATIGKAVEEIVEAQYDGFAICFVAVVVIVTIGLKSIRLGLLAVIPNFIPLILLAGLLRLSSDTADSDILAVAIISIGLAVDDTIHFIHRFCVHLPQGKGTVAAVSSAFDYTGQAILRTTITLAFGYLPFAFSGYFSLWMIGVYLVAVLIFAVLGDLLVLPALLILFVPDGEKTPSDLDSLTADPSGSDRPNGDRTGRPLVSPPRRL